MLAIILLSLMKLALMNSESPVAELTADNFTSFVKQHSAVMIQFYSYNCPYSQAFRPAYENAGRLAMETGKPYKMARVNVDAEEELADRYHIATVPALKLFLNGYPVSYCESREEKSMVEFIERTYRDIFPSTELVLDKQVKRRLKVNATEAILISDNTLYIEEFKEIARSYEQIGFFHTSEEAGKKVFKHINKFPAIILLRGINSETAIYTDTFDKESISNFLKQNTKPAIREFDQESITLLFKEEGHKGIVLFRERDEEGKRAEEVFKELALKYRNGGFVFVVSSAEEGLGKRIAKMLSVTSKDLPHIEIIEKNKELERHKFTGKFSIEEMSKFVKNWMELSSNKRYDL